MVLAGFFLLSFLRSRPLLMTFSSLDDGAARRMPGACAEYAPARAAV
jgi:hypothetical protein